jgi:hypothetical protein
VAGAAAGAAAFAAAAVFDWASARLGAAAVLNTINAATAAMAPLSSAKNPNRRFMPGFPVLNGSCG